MRLLVVEDEVELAAALVRGLEAEGFAVDVATNGTDGLWHAQHESYDAIVLDIMLPGMNGYAICKSLRADGNWTPILMLTAKEGEYDQAEGLDLGADDYLTKPFSYVVLVARLRALLRRGMRERPSVIVLGDLSIDPASRLAHRGDVELPLTAKEFSVLEYLARRAGEVVPKSDILEHVWDFAFDGDSNVVEVYISALRRKIDAPFGRQSIHTARGAGYRLATDGG
ncbi:MAG: response regulator transcription factor [Acidimicrobiia bacterium]